MSNVGCVSVSVTAVESTKRKCPGVDLVVFQTNILCRSLPGGKKSSMPITHHMTDVQGALALAGAGGLG